MVPTGRQVQHLPGVHLAAEGRRQGGVPEVQEPLGVRLAIGVDRAPQHLRDMCAEKLRSF